MGDDFDVPEKVKTLEHKFHRAIETCGDGACGIHALFGSPSVHGLYQADARGFLRQKLGPTSGDLLRNSGSCRMLHRVMNWVWIRIIKPHAERDAGVRPGLVDADFEEGLIWGKLRRYPQLVLACVEAVTQ